MFGVGEARCWGEALGDKEEDVSTGIVKASLDNASTGKKVIATEIKRTRSVNAAWARLTFEMGREQRKAEFALK